MNICMCMLVYVCVRECFSAISICILINNVDSLSIYIYI